MPRQRDNTKRLYEGVAVSVRLTRDELGQLDDLCGWMELPRDEVIRRALAMLQHGAFVWNAPSSWSVGLMPRKIP